MKNTKKILKEDNAQATTNGLEDINKTRVLARILNIKDMTSNLGELSSVKQGDYYGVISKNISNYYAIIIPTKYPTNTKLDGVKEINAIKDGGNSNATMAYRALGDKLDEKGAPMICSWPTSFGIDGTHDNGKVYQATIYFVNKEIVNYVQGNKLFDTNYIVEASDTWGPKGRGKLEKCLKRAYQAAVKACENFDYSKNRINNTRINKAVKTANKAQATPAQATPAQATPAQATPAQAAPAQATPAQAAPAQATPAQATPQTQAIQQNQLQESELKALRQLNEIKSMMKKLEDTTIYF